MLSSNDLQSVYIKLYKNLRNYIWDFQIVEMIANLEISVYKVFPDVNEIRNNLISLKNNIKDVLSDDEDLSVSFQNFSDTLDSEDITIYAKLNQLRGVIQS